jgi:hypothetical protein
MPFKIVDKESLSHLPSPATERNGTKYPHLNRHFREEGPRCLTSYCILRSRVVEAALETSPAPCSNGISRPNPQAQQRAPCTEAQSPGS